MALYRRRKLGELTHCYGSPEVTDTDLHWVLYYALRLNSSLIHSNDLDKSKVKKKQNCLSLRDGTYAGIYDNCCVWWTAEMETYIGTNTDVIMSQHRTAIRERWVGIRFP